MPNRELRENIRHSEKVAGLSDKAFRLFVLLISCADDFGRYLADPRLVRAACFPYDDSHPLADVRQALAELDEKNVIDIYSVDGKSYLHIRQWKQRKRANKSKYPAPPPEVPDNCQPHDGQTTGTRVRITNNEERITRVEERGDGDGVFPLPEETYQMHPALKILHHETLMLRGLTLRNYLECEKARSQFMDFEAAATEIARRAELKGHITEPGTWVDRQFSYWEKDHRAEQRQRREEHEEREEQKGDLIEFLLEVGYKDGKFTDVGKRNVEDCAKQHGKEFIEEVMAVVRERTRQEAEAQA